MEKAIDQYWYPTSQPWFRGKYVGTPRESHVRRQGHTWSEAVKDSCILIEKLMRFEVRFSSCGYWVAESKRDSDCTAEGFGVVSFLKWIDAQH